MTELLRPADVAPVRRAPAAIAQQIAGASGQPQMWCEHCRLTLLYAGSLAERPGAPHLPLALAQDVAALAQRHAGVRDPYASTGTLLLFAEAAAAVRAALDLQRLAGARLRIGLTTLTCEVARIRDGGREVMTLVGPEERDAAQVAARASNGSIMVAPSTYALVHPDIEYDCRDCLVAEEFDGAAMASLTITPAPERGGPEISTFAGLGAL